MLDILYKELTVVLQIIHKIIKYGRKHSTEKSQIRILQGISRLDILQVLYFWIVYGDSRQLGNDRHDQADPSDRIGGNASYGNLVFAVLPAIAVRQWFTGNLGQLDAPCIETGKASFLHGSYDVIAADAEPFKVWKIRSGAVWNQFGNTNGPRSGRIKANL